MSDGNNMKKLVYSKVNELTHTLLYEGYSLFPYYRTAVKNQKPIPFGVVYPKAYTALNKAVSSEMQTQCLLQAVEDALLSIEIRFLQLTCEETGEPGIQWKTIERSLAFDPVQIQNLCRSKKSKVIQFSSEIYTQNINGSINLAAKILDRNIYKVTVQIINNTPLYDAESMSRDTAFLYSFLSCHSILHCNNGVFISQQAPPEALIKFSSECENINTWPILIDEENTCMLSSPIILYDHPNIHPQSAGDLFDGTEMEEALWLHVKLLTEEDRQKIAGDPRLEAILQKANDMVPEEFSKFHNGLKPG